MGCCRRTLLVEQDPRAMEPGQGRTRRLQIGIGDRWLAGGPAAQRAAVKRSASRLVLLLALAPAVRAAPPYLGPDGSPLPFRTEEEVLEFLREATVVSLEDVSVGTARTKKVLLEGNGVRTHASFRHVYKHVEVGSWGFVDSYQSEVAAYELSRLLGLDRVPPTVVRRVRRKRGSLQLWIEGSMTDADRRHRGLTPPDPSSFEAQLAILGVFDNLIANGDRNPGNLVIDAAWRVWFIDHTRSFSGHRELRYPERITGCERRLWEKVRTVPASEIRARLRPHTGPYLTALLERRALLIEEIERQIAERGEAAVLFDLE